MASEYEVAKAVVTLIPSMKGSQATITKEITGAASGAGESAGKIMGENMSEGLDGSKDSMAKTALGITAGVLAAATAVGTAIMNAFKEVDAGLDIIQQKTGASGADMENMRDSMENLATSIPTSFEEAGSAIGEVNTRFKLTGQDLEDLSGKFIKFAQLNNTDVSTSVDNVSKVVNAFGMDAEDAGSLLDALNQVGQDTGVDMNTLATTLSQNAAQLQGMGLSAYDAAGFLGACDVAGLEMSTTMMGLKTAMKNASQDGKTLDEFLGEFTGTMNSNASESEKLSAAYEAFGTRAGGAIYNAVQNGKIDLEEMTGYLGDFEGSVDNTFEAVLDPTDEFTEAMNRVKIAGADIAESMMPMVAGALEGIAGALDAVIGAFTPAESVLTNFISDTQSAIDANREAVEKSSSAVDTALAGVAELEIYKDTLIELNGKAELTEFEQYQLKDAVSALADTVPGLKEAYDETNGTLDLTNQQLEDMITNAQGVALQNALIKAQEEAYDNLAQAIINQAMAQSANDRAWDEYNNTIGATYSGVENIKGAIFGYSAAMSDQQKAIYDSGLALADANEVLEQAKQDMDVLPDAIQDVAEEYGIELPAATDTASDSLENVGDSATESAEEVAAASVMTEEEMKAAEEAAQKLEAEFNSLRDSIQSSVENSITYLGEFTHAEATSTEEMIGNLSASNDYISGWITNMDLLGQHISEMSGTEQAAFQALYDDMLEKGPQTAGEAAAAMAQALSEGQGDFDAVVAEYSKSLDLTADSVKLAQYSSTGKAVAGEIATGMEAGSSDVVDAAAQMTTDVTDEVDTGMEDAVSAYDGSLDAMESSTNTSANIIETRLSQMVLNLKKKMAEEIKGPNIKLPHFKLNGDFNLQTKSVPVVSVDWYAQGGIFTKPTIFATPYGLKGIGESGAEAVLPIDLLKNYVADAVSAVASNVFNIEMTVNGAESPEAWAATFARSLKQQMRMG